MFFNPSEIEIYWNNHQKLTMSYQELFRRCAFCLNRIILPNSQNDVQHILLNPSLPLSLTNKLCKLRNNLCRKISCIVYLRRVGGVNLISKVAYVVIHAYRDILGI